MIDILEWAAPGPGKLVEILPGIHWMRLPLPLKLDHVNLWVLEDDRGLTVIDTGLGNQETRRLWAEMLSAAPGGAALRRIVVTHHHPDHCGLADRLTEERGAELLASSVTHEAGLVLERREKGTDARSTATRLAGHGLSPEAQELLIAHEDELLALKPGLPPDFTPLQEGDTISTGRYSWRVIFGQGHAPDHVCLYARPGGEGVGRGAAGLGGAAESPAAGPGVLISGDMVLPYISTHVGSPAAWLPGNPVALFQESVRGLAELPDDTVVLPSHGDPFVGLRERVQELEAHHGQRCRAIADALGEPRSAAELLQVIFQRELDPLQLMLAMNEAIAHLEYMTERRELERLPPAEGVTRYVRKEAL